MQPTKIINVVIRGKKTTFYYQLGGSSDVGLLIENHPKINLIAGENLLSNEGVVPLSWITSYIASLSGKIHD